MRATKFHQYLESIGIPVEGVADLGNGFEIQFRQTATEQQRQQATTIATTFIPTPDSDWEGFYDNFEDSAIDAKLQTSTATTALRRLESEFAKRESGYLSVTRLKKYWNRVVAGLVVPLSAGQIAGINNTAATHNLPLRLNASGQMVDYP